MRMLRAISIIGLAACGHESTPTPTPQAPQATTKLIDPSKELSPLVARLEYEATHRPATAASAERIFDELDHAGVAVVERRQYLGASLRASFCLGGQTRQDVTLAVCEYPTHEAAVDGKAFMDQRFAAMAPGARREVQATSVLTVVDPDPGVHAEVVARAFQTFAAIPPRQASN